MRSEKREEAISLTPPDQCVSEGGAREGERYIPSKTKIEGQRWTRTAEEIRWKQNVKQIILALCKLQLAL